VQCLASGFANSIVPMTLIARILIDDDAVPLFFADALLSAEGKWPFQVDITASQDINALLPSDAECQIAGTVQKINVLSDRVVVAWAGDTDQAKRVIGSIAKLDQDNRLTFATLSQLIEASKDEIKDTVALIGVLFTRNDIGEVINAEWFDFNGDLRFLNSGNVSYDVMVAGTGKNTFLKLFDELLPTFEDNSDLLALADQIAASLISTLFPYEIMTGGNLLEWWGGAFEIATFNTEAKAIQKVSDILFTFWRVTPGKEGQVELALVPRFIKQGYFEDALVLQDVKADISDGKMARPVLHAHMVLPLLKSKVDYDFSKAELGNFSHKMLCAFILPHDAVSPEDIGVRVYWNANGEDKFDIALTSELLSLSIAKEFVATLESDIASMLGVSV
jgi:hypothetical protein